MAKKLNKATLNTKIIKKIEDGLSDYQIYKALKVAPSTFNIWKKEHEQEYNNAKEVASLIVNKAVDLALLEGDGTNGFVSISQEKDVKKVKAITATKYVDAIEDAVDFVRQTQGTKYLVVTSAQRKAILAEVRALNVNARVKNDDAEIASEVGVDELIVYTGTKAIKATVLVDQAYHIDMKDLTKVDALIRWMKLSVMLYYQPCDFLVCF